MADPSMQAATDLKTKIPSTYFLLILLLLILLIFGQCKFSGVTQPKGAQPGEIIEVFLTVIDDIVPEPNPRKGVLCILVPQDWNFVSGEYDGSLGSGQLELAPDWADSVEAAYPAYLMGEDMKWIGTISDTGYTYQNPVTLEITVRLQVGQTEGCFELGYLVTKATSGLIGAGDPSWAPLSFPHPIGIPDSTQCDWEPQEDTVRRAVEWESLFTRRSGWTGADGIYSIPFSGLEVPSDEENWRTCFVFSDTFIGEVDSTGQRSGAVLVNNTLAYLKTNRPDPEKIQFFWGVDQYGRREAIFKPDTPEAKPGDWYWLMDGIAIDDRIYVYAIRLQKANGGIWNFEVIGVVLISFYMDSTGIISDVQQLDTPLFLLDESDGSNTVLGQAVMPMTERSGNPNPDGYIYVYGPKSTPGNKDLMASRVLPQDIENFTEYEYWNGSSWSSDITECASITNRISQEFSVTPLSNGQFILVFQLGHHVGIRMGESPTGPFGLHQEIWQCPEVEIDPAIFVYNAKAHPHLSTSDELLISYNVNTFNGGDHFTNADIYRPRFIWYKTDVCHQPSRIAAGQGRPERSLLLQNYPNPFNHETSLSFRLLERCRVELKIFNVRGQEVRTFDCGLRIPGIHSVRWDGRDDYGESCESGCYVCRIEVDETVMSRKMLLFR